MLPQKDDLFFLFFLLVASAMYTIHTSPELVKTPELVTDRILSFYEFFKSLPCSSSSRHWTLTALQLIQSWKQFPERGIWMWIESHVSRDPARTFVNLKGCFLNWRWGRGLDLVVWTLALWAIGQEFNLLRCPQSSPINPNEETNFLEFLNFDLLK